MPAQTKLVIRLATREDLAAIVRANCYLVVPPEATELPGDSYVTVLLKD